MTRLDVSQFYKEVMSFLEDIEALYEEHGLEEEPITDDESEDQAGDDSLVTFMSHIRDALDIASTNS